MNKKLPLLIFDCDGVLVNSEPISSRILAEELRTLGLKLSNEEAIKLFTGGKLKDAFDYAANILNISIPDNIEGTYRQKCSIAFEKELKAISGIKNALEVLPHKKCVASNGPKNKIAANLKITGLTHFFDDHLFSAYDIQQWKPNPELFLEAANRLEFDPSECIVIEDSPTGVQAAVKANMKVMGYDPIGANEEHFSDLGALVFKDMSKLPQLISF